MCSVSWQNMSLAKQEKCVQKKENPLEISGLSSFGGEYGDRTRDLKIANLALSQLS